MARLARLLEQLGGACELAGEGGPEILDVRLDSRLIGAGDLFAALPGRTADGARFVAEAVARGATAILSPARLFPAPAVPNWVHPSARRIAGEAAALVHGRPSSSMLVVGVTGTNGKTTTAHLVGQLLTHAGRRPAVLGTTGNVLAGGVRLPATHTTPDATELQRLFARHRALGGDAVALELSSHALEQERHAGLELSVAIFTNLTRDHLDYHGDMERYAAAKERLFQSLSSRSVAVVNADDPAAGRMSLAARACGARVVTFSTRSRADLRASGLLIGSRDTRITIQGMGISRTRVRLPLVGRYNVENALAALAAVLQGGASPSNALEGLATVAPAPGRIESVPTGELDFTLLVDYAHTEDALRKVLETLREGLASEARVRGDHGGRLIVVFGCGGDRDAGKRAPMGAVAGQLADVAIVTSDNPRGEDPQAIVDAVLEGLGASQAEVLVELDRRRAIQRAVRLAHAGDVLLIAGKGHETTQTIGAQVTVFDDRSVAAEALRERAESGG